VHARVCRRRSPHCAAFRQGPRTSRLVSKVSRVARPPSA
jgi:hypothetical protein